MAARHASTIPTTAPVHTLRADGMRTSRVRLHSPITKKDGSKVYVGVLVTVGDRLDYGDRVEVVTEQAVTDPAYLEALAGLTLTIRHPPGDEVTPEVIDAGDAVTIGTVLSAEVVDGAVVVRVWVQRAADQQVVEAYGELSEGYHADTEIGADGTIYQIRRVPNHVAVVPAGRAKSNKIQVDAALTPRQGADMEEKLDKILEMLAAMVAANADMAKRMDMYMPKAADAGGAAGAAAPAAPAAAPAAPAADTANEGAAQAVAQELGVDSASVRGDAATVRSVIRRQIDQAVAERVAAIARVRADAARHQIELSPDLVDPVAMRRALAIRLGADPKRADSADYCDAVIAHAAPGGGVRADGASHVPTLMF